jgi:phage terminase small subunit
MGALNVELVREWLAADNPDASLLDLRVFSDALLNYFEATENLQKNGVIVANSRTGEPFENPYLKIQERSGAILRKFTYLQTDATLKRCREACCETV